MSESWLAPKPHCSCSQPLAVTLTKIPQQKRILSNMNREFLNLIYYLLVLLCMESCQNKKLENGRDIATPKIKAKIKNIIINDSLYRGFGIIQGIISIIPINNNTYVSLSETTIDSLLFKDDFKKLPVLAQTKFIKVNYIDYCPLIVCFPKEDKHWFKIQPYKENQFYFLTTYSHEVPSRDTLYFDLPFQINNLKIDKVFKFCKGSLTSDEFPEILYSIKY